MTPLRFVIRWRIHTYWLSLTKLKMRDQKCNSTLLRRNNLSFCSKRENENWRVKIISSYQTTSRDICQKSCWTGLAEKVLKEKRHNRCWKMMPCPRDGQRCPNQIVVITITNTNVANSYEQHCHGLKKGTKPGETCCTLSTNCFISLFEKFIKNSF